MGSRVLRGPGNWEGRGTGLTGREGAQGTPGIPYGAVSQPLLEKDLGPHCCDVSDRLRQVTWGSQAEGETRNVIAEKT